MYGNDCSTFELHAPGLSKHILSKLLAPTRGSIQVKEKGKKFFCVPSIHLPMPSLQVAVASTPAGKRGIGSCSRVANAPPGRHLLLSAKVCGGVSKVITSGSGSSGRSAQDPNISCKVFNLEGLLVCNFQFLRA